MYNFIFKHFPSFKNFNIIIKVKILNQLKLSKAHLLEIMIYLVGLIIIRQNILYLPLFLVVR